MTDHLQKNNDYYRKETTMTYGKVIFIPYTRGGYLDFWGVIKDDGRQLQPREIRTIINGCNFDELKTILKRTKHDYILEDNRNMKTTAFMRFTGSAKLFRDALAGKNIGQPKSSQKMPRFKTMTTVIDQAMMTTVNCGL